MKIFCTPNMKPIFNIELLFRKDSENRIVSIENSPSLIGCEFGKRLQYILMPGAILDTKSNNGCIAIVVKYNPTVHNYGSIENVKFYTRLFGLNVIANKDSHIRVLEVKIDISEIPKWYKNVVVSIERTGGFRYMLLDLNSVGEDGIFKGYILDSLCSVKVSKATAAQTGTIAYPSTSNYSWNTSHLRHYRHRQTIGSYLDRTVKKTGIQAGLLNTAYLSEFAKGFRQASSNLNYSTL